MFLVELIVSSFLDLISKQAGRNAAVSVFLLMTISTSLFGVLSVDYNFAFPFPHFK